MVDVMAGVASMKLLHTIKIINAERFDTLRFCMLT
jgi:hypothetical protein